MLKKLFYSVRGSLIILTAVVISTAAASVSVALYIPADPSFSFFTHWLPTYGKTVPEIPAHVFNTGVILTSPLLAAGHVFIARFLEESGARSGLVRAGLVCGILSSTGELFVGLIRADSWFTGHLVAALFFFFGAVLFGIFYSAAELTLKHFPKYPAMAGLLMSGCFTVFTTLLVATQIDPTLGRNLPAPWEWLSFLTISIWGIAHALHMLRKQH